MSDAAVRDGPGEAADNSSESTPDELAELRDLLLAPEQVQLGELQERLDSPARFANDVSRVLPSAFSISLNRDDKLADSLMPTVETAIAVSVKNNPQRLVDAIFPVMGPAIRKAIANAFGEMVQSLNQTLDHSLSIRGLKWRLEALRTGKSFAEVVLSHTLLYRVEQVFLIHRQTGLLLQHVEAGSIEAHDADLVSGMLTAIQDFVHDSFGGDRDESLDSIEMGDLTVWVERGPQAVLATVIRGNAPLEFHRTMQDALDAVHVEQRDELENFSGDAAPFVASRPHLENCLQSQTETRSERGRPSPILIVALTLIVLAIGVWLFFSIRADRRWNSYLSRLNQEPGLVVVSAARQGGKYRLVGLRDPLAADPEAILKTSSIDPKDIDARWESYQASDPDIVLARMKRLLEPPATVSLSIENGALVARGSASQDWIRSARKIAEMMPSVARFIDDDLIDTDLARAQIELLRQSLEQRAIRFAVGSSEITIDQRNEIAIAALEIRKLTAFSSSLGETAKIEIWGHADQSGSSELNERLIASRAAEVSKALIAAGIPENAMEIIDASVSGSSKEFTRSTNFKLKLQK